MSMISVKMVPPNKSSSDSAPSTLNFVPKPNLGRQYVSEERYKQEKMAIDISVKNAIILTPNKFTEWLFEKGLIRNYQLCQVHVDKLGRQIPYKLGIYPNIQKFPHSGGFVWVSECCPSKWISVYYYSLFEGESHPPITILKLIYHWLFQSQIVQVLNWVAVLSVGLNETSKVDVLGVMEVDSSNIKLKAFEPLDNKVKQKYGIHILRSLLDWVHLDSTIFIDSSISKQALIGLGFTNVIEGPSYQDQNLSLSGAHHNHNVMHYLRTTVLSLLQSKLVSLQTSVIQQFLDELVWREVYGRTPQDLFSNFIQHLAEMTHLNLNENLKKKLERIQQDPSKNVKFDNLNFLAGNQKPKESIIFKESTRATPLYKEMVNADTPSPSRSPQVISL
ncbi:hypothetical protein M8J76_002316 [Diaphorina citri]|nr:hypothetical protein M8J75_008257 [Diaphorina citri]KAI5736349.1 hypothetical protein M8J76_002316 [Diaphorina citri]